MALPSNASKHIIVLWRESLKTERKQKDAQPQELSLASAPSKNNV
jgi:hypothetical protein